MTAFGYGGDANLQDKIAKLKQKRKSSKERVAEFLETELHVDPRDLPLSLDGAKARLSEIMAANGSDLEDLADIVGNSLGLKSVAFKSGNLPSVTCTRCNVSNGYWATPAAGKHRWFCYECDDYDPAIPVPDATIKIVTEKDHDGEDWHDLERCHAAFVKYVKSPDPCPKDQEQVTHYSFQVTKHWNEIQVEGIVASEPAPDISKHPTGATLRIQKATFTNGDMDVESIYVRVGGLFSDTEIVNLKTMEPIPDLTGWTVVEEL